MSSVNQINLLGRVGNEPEAKTVGSDTRIAKLSLATSRKYKDKEDTQWHRLTAFGKVAEIIERYVHKGDLLYVSGRMEYSQTEHEGQTRYWADVIVQDVTLMPKASQAESEPSKPARPQGTGMDAELPF